MGVALAALIAATMATLFASLGALETEGGNKALPTLWVVIAVGWIVLVSVRATLVYTA